MAKTIVVGCRLTEEEYEQVIQAARAAGLRTPSTWVGKVAREALDALRKREDEVPR